MEKRYELGRRKDLRVPNSTYYFFIEIYNPLNDKKLGEFKENCLRGLARKVLRQFELSKEDQVKSKMNREIKNDIGEFPVSDEELVEFYKEFKEGSSYGWEK
jgi:hypothetical protein